MTQPRKFKTNRTIAKNPYRIRSCVYVLISFFSGSAAVYLTGINEWNFGDSFDYLKAASAIENREVYPREGSLPFFRPPGYPALIALNWLLFGEGNVWSIKVMNILFHVVSTHLIYKISTAGFNPDIGYASSLVFALNPFSLYQVGSISTESVTAFLFLLFTYCVTSTPSISLTLMTMFSSLLLIFTRPEFFFVVIPIIVIVALRRGYKSNFAKQTIVVLTAIMISILTWGNSNLKSTGHFIPFTDAANYHLWMGSLEIVRNNYSVKEIGNSKFDQQQWDALVELIEEKKEVWGSQYANGDIKEKSDLWWEAFIESIKEQGLLNYFELLFLKGIMFWRPFLNPASYSMFTIAITTPFILFYTVVFVVGIWKFRKLNSFFVPFFSYMFCLAILTLVHMLQLPDFRYRVPVFAPITSIFVGALFGNKFRKRFNEFGRRMRDLNPR